MAYCLQNKCHAISTVCLQLRESVGYRYRRCVLCSYLEEALPTQRNEWMETVERIGRTSRNMPSGKPQRALKSSRRSARIHFVISRSCVRVTPPAPKSIENFGFRCLFVVKIRKFRFCQLSTAGAAVVAYFATSCDGRYSMNFCTAGVGWACFFIARPIGW